MFLAFTEAFLGELRDTICKCLVGLLSKDSKEISGSSSIPLNNEFLTMKVIQIIYLEDFLPLKKESSNY